MHRQLLVVCWGAGEREHQKHARAHAHALTYTLVHHLIITFCTCMYGTFTGSLAVPLALRGASVSASDISSSMASEAQKQWVPLCIRAAWNIVSNVLLRCTSTFRPYSRIHGTLTVRYGPRPYYKGKARLKERYGSNCTSTVDRVLPFCREKGGQGLIPGQGCILFFTPFFLCAFSLDNVSQFYIGGM